MKIKELYKISECGILIAMSVGLSFIKIPIGALGGSIDFVMIPLFIIAFRNGPVLGITSGMVFGFIKCLIGGGIGWGLPSVLLDYVFAYGAVGLSGVLSNRYWSLELSTFLGCFARFAVHVLSGVVLYAITVPTGIAATGRIYTNPFIYSVVYNMIYMLPNTVIAIVVMSLLRYPLKKLPKK